jgi:hypothetical protein
MKQGEKAWVLCEVAGDSPCGAVLMKGPQGTLFWANQKDLKPVEPEATDSKKRNAIFTMQGHTRQGTYGVAKYYGGSWLFETVDGKFSRWCDSQDIELLEGENSELPVKQSSTVEEQPPKSGLQLLLGSDTVHAGDLLNSSRDGKFHWCNFTIGMKVCDAVMRGEQQRETWTFYRPKVKA